MASSECPVSAITQRSFDLVQITNSLMTIKEATGASMEVADMPGHLFDAIRICQTQSDVIHEAMDEARDN